MLALSRPPVVSSPLPSSRYGAEPVRAEPAGHVGQRARVDHAGPQLGQPPLGQVRVVVEQRGGDHHAEHRVAEELQPLVGGQAAVLVRVRAVGQRPLQQLGLERRRRTPPPDGPTAVGDACRSSCGVTSLGRAVGRSSSAAVGDAAMARAAGAAGRRARCRRRCRRRRRRRGRPRPCRRRRAGPPRAGIAAGRRGRRPARTPPSMPLSSTLPVKPSVTTTSARAPRTTSCPSTRPT